MANTVIELRRSNVSGNVPSSLANGEIAINTYDGKLFYRGGVSNTIQTIERFQGPAGLNTEIQFNDSGVLGSDSGLTYNKTTDVLTVVGGAIVGGVNVTPQIQFAFTQANAAFTAANSAGVYANGAFAKANTQDTINLTQNNSITAAFAAANAATATDTTQNNSITASFNTANASFTRANNSVNANTGGTITGDISITGNLTVDTNTLYVDAANNEVGIGTTTPGYKLEVNGSFAATTKSFVILHPTKNGMKLRYGSLEGPENGVYIRGRTKQNIIELPEYWTKLVDSESITVNLTPIGNHQNLFVEKIKDNKIYIKSNNVLNRSIDCFYIVFAERDDVEKLKVEYDT